MGRFRGAEVLLLERRHDHVGRADGRRDERKGRHHQRQELIRTAAAREFGDKGARRDEKDPIDLNRNVILVWTCIK